MGLFQNQYNKVLAQEILKYMLLGRLPNISAVTSQVSKILGSDGHSIYKYASQPSRSVFQNEVYNKGLRQIKFDVSLLHEEILNLVTEASERISYADLYHKVNSYELSKLEAKLNSLLFTVQNADFYFLGAFETFSDMSKLDKKESTSEIINLSEGAIQLPFGGKNTQKIKVSSVVENTKVLTPNAISFGVVPGTSIDNIFVDTVSAWGYEVINSSTGPVSIQIRFPLAGSNAQETEILINRIELVPHSPSTQRALVKLSNDNVNYIAPLGYESGIDILDQKLVYALDFETNLVQYVEITLTKNGPDREIINGSTKTYQYLFGLKNFSAFTVGRVNKARYQSLPFNFANTESISRVSIQADSLIPKNSSIYYSVALADKDDQLVTSFIPLTPINQSAKSIGATQVVNFNTVASNSLRLTVPSTGNDSPQTYGRPFQGKTFYRIGPKLAPKPIYGSCKLYRGFKSWYRDGSQTFELVRVGDNYISFEQSDSESLYTWITEVPTVTVEPSTPRTVHLDVSKSVYYNSARGHLMKPPASIGSVSSDLKPNYAISKINVTGATARRTVYFTLQGTSTTQSLPVTNFLIQSANVTDLPVLQTSNGQVLRANIDYIILTEDLNGKLAPTGSFSVPPGSALLNSAGTIANPSLGLQFVYTNDPDVTHKVTSIIGNSIVLNNLIISAGDSVQVTYRYVPAAPSEILKPSVRVSNLPSTSSGRIFYVEGADYTIDQATGGIQRIPGGKINDRGSVYAEYTFRNASSNVQTFTTWCNITDSSGVQIKFEVDSTNKNNKLVADTSVGEAFYVNTSQGLIDLTKSVNTPVLGPGWIQLVVRSKNPSANQNYGSNLINQVIQIRDQSGKKVFRDNNFYFKEMICLRDPLTEITLNHLKVNTLSQDHKSFAIDDITSPLDPYIVLNFLPNATSELYLYGPTTDTDTTSNPVAIPEEFSFSWDSKLVSNVQGSKVIVRIDLERTQDSDGASTPKVFEYKLRAGT